MGKQIFWIVFCANCGRVRKHGVWVRVSQEIREDLIAREGQWDTIEMYCPHCEEHALLMDH